MLPQVSRTFALTIPQLPCGLRDVVTNAYLLCRIADTVEDEPTLSPATKDTLQGMLMEAIEDPSKAERFRLAATPLLSARTLPAEHELVDGASHVIARTSTLPHGQRSALTRCLRIMCEGMARFQRRKSVRGLATVAELREYCYVVAGVVGEMLTELFCTHSPAIASQRAVLMDRSVAFGRGLQMTNILKDIWEDRADQTCWLPREVFLESGFDLANLTPGQRDGTFEAGLEKLIALAHANLREALVYTQSIPRSEVGIRRFCLWSIGLAVLTLRKIYRRPFFTAGHEVKVSRRAVRGTILLSNLAGGSNRIIERVFDWFAADLPAAEPTLVAHAANR
jgi:farnesyl-diphosphate farnesyltransferase